MFLSLPIYACVMHTRRHTHTHLYTPDDVQLAPCPSSRLRHSVQLPPSLPPSLFLQSSPLLSQAALLPPPPPPAALPACLPDCSSISCISPSLIILRETESERVGQPDFVCIISGRVFACVQLGKEGGREEAGVYPSEELFPVVVTNRTPTASHYFTAAAISPSVLSEPDTLTCLSPPPFSPLSLHIQQRCPPLLLITLPLLQRCSLLEGDTGLLLTH